PPPTAVPQPLPVPPVAPPAPPPAPVYDGPFGVREAERLLWRGGFGPRPGEARALADLGLAGAVAHLTRPAGTAALHGPEPVAGGAPLAPADVHGHDHVWWLDRMVRSDQPLVERMALIWHDWFATSNADVNRADLMLAQNELFRRRALGSFRELVHDVTVDPAMLVWLNGIDNRRGRPNENYARELMELFTLGADRGAYTEADVRELARALTGWRATWDATTERLGDFRFDPTRFDATTKTLWAGTGHQRAGAFGWREAGDLCLENPYHRSFLVTKLWSSFVPTPADAGTQAWLEHLYLSGGFAVRPVVEAILLHPDLHRGPVLVKSPAVFAAGLLRGSGGTITTASWYSRGERAGQRLFQPPNVSGWNDAAWLDTSTFLGRWELVVQALDGRALTGAAMGPDTESPEAALAAAVAFWGEPSLSDATRSALLAFAAQPPPTDASTADWRAQRVNALRHLVAMSPDLQVS
ncbi:MAG: DUF1800 domain-containing protein, partial [Actinomycetota bacterium]|nr:DUF1800 domain-containing protein [Actinomycetota bacterium]